MPEVFDWQRVADPHAVIQYAVQSLRQGRTVAFPSASGYVVTASALVSEAVAHLPVGGLVGGLVGGTGVSPVGGTGVSPVGGLVGGTGVSPVGGLVGGTGVSPVLPELTLAVRDAAEVRDWAPGLSLLGQRLARRLWPGPVTLIVGGDIENGLASRLPDEVRARLCVQGALRLAMPEHEALREVLRHLPDPLVMAMSVDEASGVASAPRVSADVIVADDPPSRQSATVVAVNGDVWEIVRAGAVSAEEIRRRTACRIVFVCTGNTCRSPLAEALCKKCLADRLGCAVEELPARGYHVISAGLAASAGGAAAIEAEQTARGYGADLSAHRSQPLTPELAVDADYLVGMTYSHVHALADYFGSVIIAPRLLDPCGDIADPIGCDQSVYDECGQQIWRHLDNLIAEILPSEAHRP